MSQNDTNSMFYHFSWISLVLSLLSCLILTPVTGGVALGLGIASGVKGHALGWIGAVIAFLTLCIWFMSILMILANTPA